MSHIKVISILLFLFFVGCHKKEVKPAVDPKIERAKTESWCRETLAATSGWNWGIKNCPIDYMRIEGESVEGRSLPVFEFGDASSGNTTLVISMVHGDEITPLYISLRLMNWLVEHQDEFKRTHVIVAPMVNPDGFIRQMRTRVNSRGVDLNRNLPTKDWDIAAIARWKKFGSNPRRFPGTASNSEPETHFQMSLIEMSQPHKIISIHAPLNQLDYDGPSTLTLDKFPKEHVLSCLKLRNVVRASSTGYYAGSLGNYAGIERGIPTLTLELPSANPARAKDYWKQFESGFRKVILFKENLASSVHP